MQIVPQRLWQHATEWLPPMGILSTAKQLAMPLNHCPPVPATYKHILRIILVNQYTILPSPMYLASLSCFMGTKCEQFFSFPSVACQDYDHLKQGMIQRRAKWTVP